MLIVGVSSHIWPTTGRWHALVTSCFKGNFINGVGVVAVGAAQEEEDENFAKRAERSWKDIYDVRERDRSMVMQSAFIVRYESFLSGLISNCWYFFLCSQSH
jgi:hypothetical protein